MVRVCSARRGGWQKGKKKKSSICGNSPSLFSSRTGRPRAPGSVARGEAGTESDVDLLVKLEPGRSLLDLIAIKQELEDLLGRVVDVVTEDAVSPYIREQVLKEAVSL